MIPAPARRLPATLLLLGLSLLAASRTTFAQRSHQALPPASASDPAQDAGAPPARPAAHPADNDPAAWAPTLAPASDEWRAALANMTLLDGFRASLFAAEPRLAQPVSLTVDDDGAVLVAETFRHHAGVTDIRDHWDWLDDDLAAHTVADRARSMAAHLGDAFADYGVAQDRLRLLRDRDGDGRADFDTVFAGGFNQPTAGIGAGVLSHDGSVYYTCIPELWWLADDDGDDVADRRTALSEGYGVHTGLLGHDLHGLVLGPDRRLYFSMGDRALNVATPDGPLEYTIAGCVLRCELDGSGLEIYHRGLRNPQELAFDDHGNLFTGDNNSDGGDAARFVECLPGGDSGWRFSYQWIESPTSRGPWNDELLWKPPSPHQAAWLLPPIANIANGPAGLACYPGTGFGPAWRNHFFLCDFLGDPAWSGVHSFVLEPRGAGWQMAQRQHFVWGALVTDAGFGPDGRLYLSDWVEGWNQTGKGRVWTVESGARDEALVDQTRRLLSRGMSDRPTNELGKLLAHPDRRVRQAAHFELADRGEPGRAALSHAALHGSRTEQRLAGLWGLWVMARDAAREADALALADGSTPATSTAATTVRDSPHGSGPASPSASPRQPPPTPVPQATPLRTPRGAVAIASVLQPIRALAGDTDAELRAQWLRVIADLAWAGGRQAALAGLADISPRVRLRAALAVGRLRLHEAVEPLLQVASEAADRDPSLRHGVVMGLIGCAEGGELLGHASDPSPHARMVAALALRRLRSPLLAPLLDRLSSSDDPDDAWIALEVVRAIHDVPVPSAEPALAALLEPDSPLLARFLASNRLPDAALVRRALAANLALGREHHARRVAELALRQDAPAALRAEALSVLGQWRQPPPRDLVMGDWRPLPSREAPWLPRLLGRLTGGGLDDAPEPVRLALLDLLESSGAGGHQDLLRAWLDDRFAPGTVRARCLTLLADLGADDFDALLAFALGDADGRLRAAALPLLQARAPAEAAAFLPTILEQGEIAERRAAYAILASPDLEKQLARRHLGAELDLLQAGLLSPELALDLVQAATTAGLGDRLSGRHAAAARFEPLLAPWLDTLFGGDVEAGRRIFERGDLACGRCHAREGAGGLRIGPGLDGVGSRHTRLALLRSVVTPNASLAPGYAGTNLFLTDGRLLSGRVVSESDQTLELLDAEGELTEVPVSELAERRAGLSAMPENLAAGLTPLQMRDLIAYLASL